jgi:hypothetical protein
VVPGTSEGGVVGGGGGGVGGSAGAPVGRMVRVTELLLEVPFEIVMRYVPAFAVRTSSIELEEINRIDWMLIPDPDNPSVDVGANPLPFKTTVKVAPSGPEEGTTLVNCGAGDCENALLESKNKVVAIIASLAMDRTDLRFRILPLEISF